jgi:hypothetical protein
MYKLVYYLKRPDGSLFNGTIVSGCACAPYGVCAAKKTEVKNTTHRSGALKIEKI